MNEDNGRVNYTVKELLAKIDLKIDGLSIKLDNKVDVERVDVLERRMDAIEHHGSRDAQEAYRISRELVVDVENLQKWQTRLGAGFGVLTFLLTVGMPIVVIVYNHVSG